MEIASAMTDRGLITAPGHSGEVFVTRFDPSGQHIASGSMDRSISRSALKSSTGIDH